MRGVQGTTAFRQSNHTSESNIHSYPEPEDNEFMDTLTYKMFNLHFSIWCGAYNAHLYATIFLWCKKYLDYIYNNFFLGDINQTYVIILIN